MRGDGTIPETLLLVIVDESGRRLDRPELAAVVGNMVRVQLAHLPGLMLPAVLKLRQGGMSELDAYAFDNRCLRVLLPAGLVRELGHPERPMRVIWELRTRVADLAANFRSRIGARGNFFRQATRAHHVVARTGRLSRDRELTPTPM